jgi:hypothetical protein
MAKPLAIDPLDELADEIKSLLDEIVEEIDK